MPELPYQVATPLPYNKICGYRGGICHKKNHLALTTFFLAQGSHGHGKSWRTIENEKIKSRPGNVIENENLAKSHGKVREFGIFINIYRIS